MLDSGRWLPHPLPWEQRGHRAGRFAMDKQAPSCPARAPVRVSARYRAGFAFRFPGAAFASHILHETPGFSMRSSILTTRRCLSGGPVFCVPPSSLKPYTLLNLHNVLTKRKYRPLFSPKQSQRPGPKGPTKELVDAVVEMKRRNPNWGCPRIAEQIALAFGIHVDKDVVRRILSVHYRPESDGGGPSWLTFLGHTKDYYNGCRTHSALAGRVPSSPTGPSTQAKLGCHQWRRHCGGLYQTPMAA